MEECSVVETPVKRGNEQLDREDTRPEMDPKEATRYRRSAARVNFMAQDRVDLAFAGENAGSKNGKPPNR